MRKREKGKKGREKVMNAVVEREKRRKVSEYTGSGIVRKERVGRKKEKKKKREERRTYKVEREERRRLGRRKKKKREKCGKNEKSIK